jgi:hypothetical protein
MAIVSRDIVYVTPLALRFIGMYPTAHQAFRFMIADQALPDTRHLAGFGAAVYALANTAVRHPMLEVTTANPLLTTLTLDVAEFGRSLPRRS